ncbi:QRFP-like peptide receptor [Lineus longissimus]|uniref:QRFP-like peptide receptor n=1 Tax=Lineus longissimus TaxID=88925 RepID=UPI00315CFFC0
MPTALMELHTREKWYLGEAMCKAVPFIENAVADASVLTILAISLERYYAICHPFRAQYMCTPTRSVKILAVVWIIAAAVAIPFIFYAALRYEEFYDGTKAHACSTAFTDQKGRVYILCSTALFFVMPLILLSLLYSIIIKRLVYDAKALLDGDVNSASAQKTRRQVVYMLISIKVLFFVCMLPFRVFSIFMIYTPMDKLADLGLEGYLNILCFSRIMFYMNSAGNPIMYNVLSTKFRNAFKRALGCSKDRRLERRLTLSTYYSAARQTPNHESTGDTESTMCL